MDVRSCLLQVSQVSGCGCEELFATTVQVSQVSGCGCEELFATSQSSEWVWM